jgi:hypothetical protein
VSRTARDVLLLRRIRDGWRRWLPALAVPLVLVACGGSPDRPASANYEVSVDFLKLVRNQCTAVSSFSNRYPQPIRVSGDIRFLDRAGRRISNVALVTDTLPSGATATKDLSLMQILSDEDLARCRSIAAYQVKVSLCRTDDGRYLNSGSCVGEFDGTVTW